MIKIKFGEPGIEFSPDIEQKLKEILNIKEQNADTGSEE